MARPTKNSCDYFPHDRDMRNHKKIKSIRAKFGLNGYAIWSMMLEYLTGNDGNVFEYSEMEFELMAGDFGVSAAEITEVLHYCIRLELLFNKEGFIHSESLDENLAPVYVKRKKSKSLSKQQLRKHGKYVTNNSVSTVVSVTEMPQSKVKDSKVNKSKVFIPPTLSEFQTYFKLEGYKLDIAERAWKGYDVANWHKSNGQPIKNWKQTCQNVWFKPENIDTNKPKFVA